MLFRAGKGNLKMNFQKWMARLGNEIELLEVNYFQTTGTEKMNIHTHPAQLHIACFERGKGLFSLNGILRKIRPGDVYLINPGEMHQFVPDPELPYRACFLHLSWYGVLPTELPHHLLLPRNERRRFFQLCRELAETWHHPKRPGGDFLLYSLLLRFFSELVRSAADHEISEKCPELKGLDKQLNPVMAALHGPPFFYPGIDALAEKTAMSRRQLTKQFRLYTGCGIKQYFLSNVMRYAELMRQSGEYRTSEIARQCGYSTPQNYLLARKNYLKNHPGGLNTAHVIYWRPFPTDVDPK